MIHPAMLEREIYVVVSTAHISAATAAALPGLDIVCDTGEHRFRLPFVGQDEGGAALPHDLAGLLAALRVAAPDAYGVMIDADGPLVPGLAVFDW